VTDKEAHPMEDPNMAEGGQISEIEVFADVWCPFAWIGLTRVVEARRALGESGPSMRVRPWPLELVNGQPQSAERIVEEVVELRRSVTPDLFVGLRADRFPRSTLLALALAESAYEVSVAAGEAVSLELRRRLFEEGQDVGDRSVLEKVGRAHGLAVPTERAARERAEAALAEGRRRGVLGSPHFFLGNADYFCPALVIQRDGSGALEVHFDQEGFSAFVVAALGGGAGMEDPSGG